MISISKRAILDNLKASIFVEYLVSLYVFNFFIELVLVPSVVFLGMMIAVTQNDQKYSKVKGCLNVTLSLLGLVIIGYSLYNAYNDLASLTSIGTAKNFASPIILSILFLPFIYLVMVYFKYESFYLRLQYFIKDPHLLRYTKLRATLFCRLDFKMLDTFAKKVIHQRPSNRKEVLDLLKNSKSG
jgi:glucose-6-phosphate-specific signal transduction histidine kinase